MEFHDIRIYLAYQIFILINTDNMRQKTAFFKSFGSK